MLKELQWLLFLIIQRFCLRLFELLVKVGGCWPRNRVRYSILVKWMFGSLICRLFEESSFRRLWQFYVYWLLIIQDQIIIFRFGSNLCIDWWFHQKSFVNKRLHIFLVLSYSFRLIESIFLVQIFVFDLRSFFDFFFHNQLLNPKLFYIWIWRLSFQDMKFDRLTVRWYILIGSRIC